MITCDFCKSTFDPTLGFDTFWGGQTSCISCADALYKED